jgi:UDP-N-acetylmuramate: L-alanyl-gamma-D-glutamyl-meso-diaminopimelate ligase
MELHTFSSLTEDFLPQYAGCMEEADIAFVYYNPEVIHHKRLKEFEPELVKNAFGGKNLEVYNDSTLLQAKLRCLNFDHSALLLMTSGNFSGVNLIEFATELLK